MGMNVKTRLIHSAESTGPVSKPVLFCPVLFYLYLRIMSITGGQTNTVRHNYLYRYFRDTVPRFQFLTKLSEACAINDADRPHVLAYVRSKFLRAHLLSCCRQRACGGRWKMWVKMWLLSWSSRHHGMLNLVHIFKKCPNVASSGIVS